MRQEQRQDIRRHLPRLRACDDALVALMGRFQPGDLEIEWEKPGVGGNGSSGQWWKERPRIPAGASGDARLTDGLTECVRCVVETLEDVRGINADVIERMEVPDAYAAALPADATKILGKETAQVLKRLEPAERQRFFKELPVADALQAHKMIGQLQDAAMVWERKFVASSQRDVAEPSRFGRLGSLMGATPNEGARRGAEAARGGARALRDLWPKAPQTGQESAKIKGNLDVGLAALEAFSRVLEGKISVVERRACAIGGW